MRPGGRARAGRGGASRGAALLGVLATAFLGASAAGVGQGRDEPLPWEVRVPRMQTPRAQLVHARRLKEGMYERPERDRRFWRGLAVEAYQAVRHFHPEATEVGAEAAFRAGELLRAAGEEGALAEFQVAVELGTGTPFRARARLEIGHLHRRAGRLRGALDAYLAVAGDARAEKRHRDDGWLWAARVWLAEGRASDARRAWRGVATGDGDPVDRVAAFDELGLSWLAEGAPERAREVLEECDRTLADAALEETRTGERTRSALLRMRLRARLEGADGLKRDARNAEKALTR